MGLLSRFRRNKGYRYRYLPDRYRGPVMTNDEYVRGIMNQYSVKSTDLVGGTILSQLYALRTSSTLGLQDEGSNANPLTVRYNYLRQLIKHCTPYEQAVSTILREIAKTPRAFRKKIVCKNCGHIIEDETMDPPTSCVSCHGDLTTEEEGENNSKIYMEELNETLLQKPVNGRGQHFTDILELIIQSIMYFDFAPIVLRKVYPAIPNVFLLTTSQDFFGSIEEIKVARPDSITIQSGKYGLGSKVFTCIVHRSVKVDAENILETYRRTMVKDEAYHFTLQQIALIAERQQCPRDNCGLPLYPAFASSRMENRTGDSFYIANEVLTLTSFDKGSTYGHSPAISLEPNMVFYISLLESYKKMVTQGKSAGLVIQIPVPVDQFNNTQFLRDLTNSWETKLKEDPYSVNFVFVPVSQEGRQANSEILNLTRTPEELNMESIAKMARDEILRKLGISSFASGDESNAIFQQDTRQLELLDNFRRSLNLLLKKFIDFLLDNLTATIAHANSYYLGNIDEFSIENKRRIEAKEKASDAKAKEDLDKQRLIAASLQNMNQLESMGFEVTVVENSIFEENGVFTVGERKNLEQRLDDILGQNPDTGEEEVEDSDPEESDTENEEEDAQSVPAT